MKKNLDKVVCSMFLGNGGTLAKVMLVSDSSDYLITKRDYDRFRARAESDGLQISTVPDQYDCEVEPEMDYQAT
eukprot:COSAG06_NODE_52176_length_307_cov_0.985577_1_plen_73_part_10